MQPNDWPAPAFSFRVRFGRKQIAFARLSGIEAAIEPAARAVRHGHVLLSRGIFRGDFTLWRWFEAAASDPEKRETVTVDLLGPEGKPMRRWTLHGARPVRIFGPDLNALANEAAIETIEIAYESLAVSSGG